MPPVRSMSSASTQWADVGWYSNAVPGSQLSRHLENAARRLSRSAQSGGPNGARGKPLVCSITCSTVMTSLSWVPNSGMYSTTRLSGSGAPALGHVAQARVGPPFDHRAGEVAGPHLDDHRQAGRVERPDREPRVAQAGEQGHSPQGAGADAARPADLEGRLGSDAPDGRR